MQTGDARSGYRPDIDGLRAIAILSVLIFHAEKAWLPGGFIGVDLFFVISGYLITGILLRDLSLQRFSILTFYQRRVRRIFPALLVVMASCFVLGWFALLPDEYRQLTAHISSASVFISNFVLWKEAGYFDAASDAKPLLHLWSLGVEEQFYILWPLLMWAAWRWQRHALALIGVLFVLSLGMSMVFTPKYDVMSFYLPLTRFWELMAGGLLAYGQQHCSAAMAPRPRMQQAFAIAGFGCIILGLATITQDMPFPGWRALWPVMGAVLIIAAGPQAWVNRYLLASRPMVFVGLISYPLYLWHWPILSFMYLMESGQVLPQLKIAGIALSVLLAWGTMRYIEGPIRFGRYAKSTRCLWVLLGCMVALGAGSAVVDMQHGSARTRGMDLPKLRDMEQIDAFRASLPKCDAKYKGQDLNWCHTNLPGQANYALLGDSHADHLMPGITALEKQRHWLLIGKSSCAPLGGLHIIESGRPDVCATSNRTALDAVVADRAIRTVVVAMRGSIYLGDTISPENRGKFDPSFLTLQEVGSDKPDDRRKLFLDGLRRTVRSLLLSGKKVVLFLDVPEMDFVMMRCVDRPMTLAAPASPTPCGVERAKVEKMRARYREITLQVQKEFPEVFVYDAFLPLCDASTCYAADDARLYYRDSNHLSQYGSTKVARDFIAWLETQALVDKAPAPLSEK